MKFQLLPYQSKKTGKWLFIVSITASSIKGAVQEIQDAGNKRNLIALSITLLLCLTIVLVYVEGLVKESGHTDFFENIISVVEYLFESIQLTFFTFSSKLIISFIFNPEAKADIPAFIESLIFKIKEERAQPAY